LCDINTFKQTKRHNGTNALPQVGDMVYNPNTSMFDGSLGGFQGATYNWYIMTETPHDGSTTVTNKYMVKIDNTGEVLDIIDCSVGSTTTTSTTTNPVTPTTTVSFASQNCPASFSYGQSGAQTFPSTTKVNLGTGVGWVDMDISTYNLPDKIIIKYLGDVVYDTGYLGDTSYQADLNTELASRGLGSETITQGSGAQIRWFKPQSYAFLDVEVYAPLAGTGWDVDVSCPTAPTTIPPTTTSSTSSTTLVPTTTLFPTTTTSTIDTDGDGVPDYLDPDDDNDGCYDNLDKYPTNAQFNADAFFQVFAASDNYLSAGDGVANINVQVFSQNTTQTELRQSYHHIINLGNDMPTNLEIWDLGQTYFGTYQTMATTQYANDGSDNRGYYYYNKRPQFDVCQSNYCVPAPGSQVSIIKTYADLDYSGGQNSFPTFNLSPYFAIINSSGGRVDDLFIVRWEDATVVATYTDGYGGNLPLLTTLT
tara:strand:- start:13782 stop:15218 length:1437 start_codon:yes stop_codon:yes gene_type:complete